MTGLGVRHLLSAADLDRKAVGDPYAAVST